MKAGGIFKAFKKGSKAVGGKKKGEAGPRWPAGIRIGVLGHANSGKTVYFTVLNEECKVSKDLQISISDTTTAGQLLTHYRSIWGVGTTSDVGTHVDLRGEKKFPAPTRGDRILQFNAIINRTQKVPVVTLDYEGKAVSISETSELRDKVADFLAGSDGLLIFYDPKMLGAAAMTQEQVAAYTNVIERLAPLSRRLPIPIALVVTKADILPGFSGDEQTVLIAPEDEHFVSNDFDTFMERVLASNKLVGNPTWAGTVREVFVRLQELLKIIVGRTLNFQVFFVSSTGATPQKIGTDVGRSIYAPPDRMKPIGVRRPFHWMLQAVLRNRGVSRMRSVAKWVCLAAGLWIVLYSLPFAYHYWWLLPRVQSQEQSVVDAHLERSGTLTDLTQNEISKITAPYRRYENRWIINWFFVPFRSVAEQIRLAYLAIEEVDVSKLIDARVIRFHEIAADSTRWPAKKVGEAVFDDNDKSRRFLTLVGEVDSLYVDEADVQNSRRKERLRWFLGKFQEAILNPDQAAQVWNQVNAEIAQLQTRTDVTLSASEKTLFAAFRRQEKKQEMVQQAKQTGGDIEAYLKTINDNPDPKFRLEDVPTRLQSELGVLRSDPANAETVAKISRYLEQVEQFKTRKDYTIQVTDAPADYHAHIMVRRGREDTAWRQGKQLWPGMSDILSWRMGDEIVIALDGPSDPESWGANSALKKVLRGRIALFDMLKPIDIGAGKTVTVNFQDDLLDMMPKVE